MLWDSFGMYRPDRTQSSQLGFLVSSSTGDSKQQVRKHKRGCERRQLTVARKNTAIPEGKERKSVICRLRNRKSTDIKSQPMLKESPIIKVLNNDSVSSINMELFPVYSVFLGGRKRTYYFKKCFKMEYLDV